MNTVEVDAEHRSILGPSVCKDPPIWMGHLRDAMALIPTGPLADALIEDWLPIRERLI